AVVRKLDLNDDEYLSPAELLPSSNQNPFAPRVVNPRSGGLPDSLFAVQSGRNVVQLTALILARYDKNKDAKLDRTETRVDKATFNRLDTNKDGFLDIGELMRYLQTARPVTVRVRLGKVGAQVRPLELSSQDRRIKQTQGGGGGREHVHFFVE